jgi:hypothetical protein
MISNGSFATVYQNKEDSNRVVRVLERQKNSLNNIDNEFTTYNKMKSVNS